MKYFIAFVIFLLGFVLQSTLLNNISILAITPNIILCLVIIFTFLYDGYFGIVFGVLFGLVQDLFFGPIVGIAALCYFIISLLIYGTKKYINKENIFSALILTIIGTLLYNLSYWLLTTLFGSSYSVKVMLKVDAVTLVYNIIISIILYFILIKKVVRHPTDKYIKGTFINYE
ncbi:rod shape-determining protein MreD [Anaerovorax odorimutans]|uniref:rod shape-determining protein MreD n=1 Tax=Anaerovorax odorimutans TaxID=109327 RepID=UPI0004279724|nr:rod shape-determining protein MreD [Anaerovorax odorimutans]